MTGEPLSPLDAAFLAAETPTMPLHVVAVTVLDRAPSRLTAEFVRSLVARRLAGQRRLWQRVARMPFGLDHPVWVPEPAPDLVHHVRRAALPTPGGPGELADFIGELAARPLDPDRPLWELLVVEGLEGDHVALVGKVHHALFDGVSGLATLAGLFDLAPDAVSRGGPPPAGAPAGGVADGDGHAWAEGGAEGPPIDRSGSWHLVSAAARRWARRPVALADTVASTYLTLRQWQDGGAEPGSVPAGPAAGTDGGTDGPGVSGCPAGNRFRPVQPVPFRVPRAPWNGTISGRRSAAMAQLCLDDMRLVTRALGGTVNDVLLTAVGGALRRRVADHPDLPGLHAGCPLVAAVPVSLRPAGTETAGGNRVSVMVVPLGTDVSAADDRYRAVRIATEAAKRRAAQLPEHLVAGWAELAVPAVAGRAVRLAANLRAFDHVAPPVNVVVSNVPGPAEPLWCAGRRVLDLHPFGPVVDGIALNISAVSYRGTLSVGLIACRDLVPALGELADDLVDATAELVKLARAAARTGSGGSTG